jgi:hypothetical protein
MLVFPVILLTLVGLSSQQQCAAPLTVRLTAIDQWSGTLEGVKYSGPKVADTIILPARSTDRVQDITVWDQRGKVLVAIAVTTSNPRANGFIASVSWNGIQIPASLTGTPDSRWKYTAAASQAKAGWDTKWDFDDSNWKFARDNFACSSLASTVNDEGTNFEDYVTANGVREDGQTAKARWVGQNACGSQITVYYRLTLDLTSWNKPTTCYDSNDFRSKLGLAHPFLAYEIGTRTSNTKLMTIRMTADNEWDIYFAGKSVVGPRDKDYGGYPYAWSRVTDINMNVVPGKYVFAIHAKDYGTLRAFIASLVYDGKLFAVTDWSAKWKIIARNSAPSAGWNTDLNYDDSSWSTVDGNLICKNQSPWRDVQPIVSIWGGCPQWMWFPNCNSDTTYTDVYIRFVVDLTDTQPKEFVACPASLTTSWASIRTSTTTRVTTTTTTTPRTTTTTPRTTTTTTTTTTPSTTPSTTTTTTTTPSTTPTTTTTTTTTTPNTTPSTTTTTPITTTTSTTESTTTTSTTETPIISTTESVTITTPVYESTTESATATVPVESTIVAETTTAVETTTTVVESTPLVETTHLPTTTAVESTTVVETTLLPTTTAVESTTVVETTLLPTTESSSTSQETSLETVISTAVETTSFAETTSAVETTLLPETTTTVSSSSSDVTTPSTSSDDETTIQTTPVETTSSEYVYESEYFVAGTTTPIVFTEPVVVIRSSRTRSTRSSSGDSQETGVYYYYDDEQPGGNSGTRNNLNNPQQLSDDADVQNVTGIAAAGSLIPIALIGAVLGFLIFRRAQKTKAYEDMMLKNLGIGNMNPLYGDQDQFVENPLFTSPNEARARKTMSVAIS